MNKKVLIVMMVLAVAGVMAVSAILNSNQDFDGHFTMDVPFGKHYSDTAYCRDNGRLGCRGEYWEDNSDCEIEGDDIVIFYYDSSLLAEGESNAYGHAINGLTTSYFYRTVQNDGDLIVLENDLEMRNLPHYLVGKSSPDGSEVVFVGGQNLDYVKNYANSIKFI